MSKKRGSVTMVLRKLPVNQAWAFLWGRTVADAQIISVGGKRYFETREEAVETAEKQGLHVDKAGFVTSEGPNPNDPIMKRDPRHLNLNGKWIYVVGNNVAGEREEFSSESKARKRGIERSKSERGSVYVEKVFLKPGHVYSYNVPGAGQIWSSEWKSETPRHRNMNGRKRYQIFAGAGSGTAKVVAEYDSREDAFKGAEAHVRCNYVEVYDRGSDHILWSSDKPTTRLK